MRCWLSVLNTALRCNALERWGRGGGRAEGQWEEAGGEDVAYLRGSTAQLTMPVSSPHKVTHHHIIFSTLRHVERVCAVNSDFIVTLPNLMVSLRSIFFI